MARTKLLVLNRDEVMLITDRITNIDHGTEEQPMSGYQLLLKLGGLYLELVDPYKTEVRSAEIAVTEAEAWLLRSRVSTGNRTSTDQTAGIKLLRKIYTLLIEFESEVDLPLTEQGGEVMNSEKRALLQTWKEKDGNDELQPA